MAMDPVLKRCWADTLRSGRYRRGIGALRHCAGYDHLGVLCDLMRLDGHGTWDGQDGAAARFPTERGIHFCVDGIAAWRELPRTLAKKLRVSVDPKARLSDGSVMLLSRRVDYGASFPEIADIIEQADII